MTDKEFQEVAAKWFMENQLSPMYNSLFPVMTHKLRQLLDEIAAQGEKTAAEQNYSKKGQYEAGGVIMAVALGTFSALCETMMADYTGTTKKIADECRRATLELMNDPEVKNAEPMSGAN